MNKPQLISFDLQGTISDNAFSDEFWLDLLPMLYARKHGIRHDKAKDLLEKDFQSKGKYHTLFYDHRLRLDEVLLNWEFQTIINLLTNKPALDRDVLNLIRTIYPRIPMIVLSATTRDFIHLELGEAKHYFKAIFSSIDDFNTPGKPPTLYQGVAAYMGVSPEACLHIGDCLEMDYENPRKAGWHSFHLNKKLPKNQVIGLLKKTLKQGNLL